MPQPRKSLLSLDATSYYHCISRCVRRAFLCGVDTVSGVSFEHRRQWIEDRLFVLARAFAIDIAAYAVMSNHYHLVLHIDKKKALAWTSVEVIQHWQSLFAGTTLTHAVLLGNPLEDAEMAKVGKLVEIWRERLMNISWFMRCLNEPIARQANEEDQVSGRFWEGRFKSQALLDDQALVACMAYVDLNPIRAKVADTPETSDHTSVKLRIESFAHCDKNISAVQPKQLRSFASAGHPPMPNDIPLGLLDYLKLVDETGRIIREDRPGNISNYQLPILERLNIAPLRWLALTQNFQRSFKTLVGCYHTLKNVCADIGMHRTTGAGASKLLFAG